LRTLCYIIDMVCGSDVALHLTFEGQQYRFKKTKNCPWMSGIAI